MCIENLVENDQIKIENFEIDVNSIQNIALQIKYQNFGKFGETTEIRTSKYSKQTAENKVSQYSCVLKTWLKIIEQKSNLSKYI